MPLDVKSGRWTQGVSQVRAGGDPPCLHELFEAQADARGDAPAIVRGDTPCPMPRWIGAPTGSPMCCARLA